MSANELSALLWRERELLELITFKLEVEQLLLTSGKTRWLSRASGEIEQVTDRLRSVGLARTVEVENVAEEWQAPEGATLRELLAKAPTGPWQEIFEAHLKALTDLTTKVRTVRDANEQLLRSAARATQETIASTGETVHVYDARGVAGAQTVDARFLDKEI